MREPGKAKLTDMHKVQLELQLIIVGYIAQLELYHLNEISDQMSNSVINRAISCASETRGFAAHKKSSIIGVPINNRGCSKNKKQSYQPRDLNHVNSFEASYVRCDHQACTSRWITER
jgi:hypothetical protein